MDDVQSNQLDTTKENPIKSQDDEFITLYNSSHDLDDSSNNKKNSSISKILIRRSMDDMNIGDSRNNRLAQAEAALRQEVFKECTFRPNIKELPSSYGPMKDADTPFNTRVSKWQRDRDLELKAKSKLIAQGEQAECTFRPKINRNSDKAVQVIRGKETTSMTQNRLYKTSELIAQQRKQQIEEKREREELEVQQACTFKPTLITKNNPLHIQSHSKFSIINTTADKLQGMIPSELKDCTFTPKINKIKPTMNSAKLYISTDVVDRLTRPIINNNANFSTEDSFILQHRFDNQSPTQMIRGTTNTNNNTTNNRGGGGAMIMNMQSFIGTLQNNKYPTNGNKSRDQLRGQSPHISPEERHKRQEKFELFLNRQQAVLKRKEEQLQQIQRSTTPKFKPTITKKAQESSMHRDATNVVEAFVSRHELDIQKRMAKEQMIEVQSGLDENCTFKPQLSTKKTQKLRSRSSFELSQGDAIRKETNRRMLKLQNDQEQLLEMTFQPQISSYAKEITGKLNINSAANSQFLDFLKQENIKKEQKRLEILRKREELEAEECTFSPKTTECPEYVKRIAKSMSIVKAARNNTSNMLDNSNIKPDWK